MTTKPNTSRICMLEKMTRRPSCQLAVGVGCCCVDDVDDDVVEFLPDCDDDEDDDSDDDCFPLFAGTQYIIHIHATKDVMACIVNM